MKIKSTNTKKRGKHFLILFIIYFLAILNYILLSYRDLSWVLKIFFIILMALSVFLLVIRILVYKEKLKGEFSKKVSYIYDIIVSWKYNFFDKEKFPPKTKKISSDRAILFSLFIILPMFFFAFLLQGSWQNNINFIQSYGNFSPEKGMGENTYLKRGELNINTQLDMNEIQRFSYFLGKEINIPLLEVCFKNNFSDPNISIGDSLNINVNVDSIDYSMLENSERCIPLDLSKNKIVYNWSVYYKTNIVSLSEDLSERVRINNNNFYLICFLLLMGWWALLNLIIKVLLYLHNGLDFKK